MPNPLGVDDIELVEDHDSPSITDIGEQILYGEVAPRIAEYDLTVASRLAQTSTMMYSVFQEAVNRQAAKKIIEHMKNADWHAVEKVTTSMPDAIFQKIGEFSPLEYSFYLYDSYSWKIFLKYIDEDQHLKFLEAADNHDRFYDFTPFYNAYSEHIALESRYLEGDPQVSESEINRHWIEKIGGAQRNLIPKHFLKQICGNINDFQWKPSIEPITSPPPTTVTTHSQDGKLVELFPFKEESKLGKEFAIYHWQHDLLDLGERTIKSVSIESIKPILLGPDLQVFRNLLNTRQTDFVMTVSSLTEQFSDAYQKVTEYNLF